MRGILPALDAGKMVLVDRFFCPPHAYQIFGRGLLEPEIRAANRHGNHGPLVPDLTLTCSTCHPPRDSAPADARGARDRMERSDDDFHQRVTSAFRQFADPKWQHSHPECGPIKLIDGTGDEMTVHKRVTSAPRQPRFRNLFGSIKG